MAHVDCCVNCGKRTDKNKKKRKNNRRRVAVPWMVNFFKAKKVNLNHNSWICNLCRKNITNLRKAENLYEQVNTTSGLFAKIELMEKSYFENKQDDYFPATMGLSKKDFYDLYGHIAEYHSRGKTLLIDGLGLYLAKLYLGEKKYSYPYMTINKWL